MTISQPNRSTGNVFLCIVKRAAVFNVFFKPARWEAWKVLADNHDNAMETAQYHFYSSDRNEILVSREPVNRYMTRK